MVFAEGRGQAQGARGQFTFKLNIHFKIGFQIINFIVQFTGACQETGGIIRALP